MVHFNAEKIITSTCIATTKTNFINLLHGRTLHSKNTGNSTSSYWPKSHMIPRKSSSPTNLSQLQDNELTEQQLNSTKNRTANQTLSRIPKSGHRRITYRNLEFPSMDLVDAAVLYLLPFADDPRRACRPRRCCRRRAHPSPACRLARETNRATLVWTDEFRWCNCGGGFCK
jgi:hypothetical protein